MKGVKPMNGMPDGPVTAYIRGGYEACRRFMTEDTEELVGLPREYTVPCADTAFQQLFYWDTYFANLGLILLGRTEAAEANLENLVYLVERFGYVPNANSFEMTNRSQPPYLAAAAEDLLEAGSGRDAAWMRRLYAALIREHAFWTGARGTPCGLSRYFHHAPRRYLEEFSLAIAGRLGLEPAAATAELGERLLAEAESGWDFTPRFGGRCPSFCPVDLNANLYRSERFLARLAGELGEEAEARNAAAAERRSLMDLLMKDPGTGLYYDYDWERGVRSETLTAASYWPLWVGLVRPEEAGRPLALLDALEAEHGVAALRRPAAERRPGTPRYQWDYPNLWPPIQYAAVQARARCGDAAGARRIAGKYLGTVTGNFLRTGRLWEKYNAASGGTDTADEYAMPPMIGWTAGVTVAFAALLERAV